MLAVPKSGLPGVNWPAVPAPVGASMLAMQYQLLQSERWTPQRLREQQLRQAQALLAHAAATVPFYADHFRAAGVYPLRPLSGEAWAQIPLLTRQDIQQAGQRLQSIRVPADHGRKLPFQSSGSTGEPIRTWGTELTHFFNGALVLREHLWHERDFGAKLAAIRTKVESATLTGWGPEFESAFQTGPSVLLNIAADVTAQLDWLCREQPDYLMTHPSNARTLARLSLERGVRPERLREIRTFGETLPPDLRALCREAWNAKVADAYSSEELGCIAFQCPRDEHYHVQAENLLVEVLNEQGEPCRPGEVGKVVATTLHNFATPLIRYQNGDYAEVGEACHCGRGLPVFKRIMGRSRNMIVVPDGRRHWPSFPMEDWVGVAPIRQIQLVQRSLSEVEVRYVMERDLDAGEAGRLVRVFQQSLGYPFDIAFLRLERLERTPGMKFEDFVSLVDGTGGVS